MNFEDYFSLLLGQAKNNTENRILKLEMQIPEEIIQKQNEFLKDFFSEDPFEIRPQDLETYIAPSGKIKQLKIDRRPSTYLSLFRFLELFRQQFQSIQNDVGALALCYKALDENQLQSQINLRQKVLTQVLAGGRILKKWQPIQDEFFQKLIKNINESLLQATQLSGKDKAFVNLRKPLSENYLSSNFYPVYESMMNFIIMCLAFTSKLKSETKVLLDEAGLIALNN
jgi:hypothetical protein